MTKQQLELLDQLIQAKIDVLASKLNDYDNYWGSCRTQNSIYKELLKLTEDLEDE